MNRRIFLEQALGVIGVGVIPASYDSRTISVNMVEEEHGITSILLTEHGDADYCIVEAFYRTTIEGVHLFLHKEATAPLMKGMATVAEIGLPIVDIAALRVKELKLLNQSEFGDIGKERK